MDTDWVTPPALKLLLHLSHLLVHLFRFSVGSTARPWCPSVRQPRVGEPHPDVARTVTFEPYVSNVACLTRTWHPVKGFVCVCLCAGSFQSLSDHFQATDWQLWLAMLQVTTYEWILTIQHSMKQTHECNCTANTCDHMFKSYTHGGGGGMTNERTENKKCELGEMPSTHLFIEVNEHTYYPALNSSCCTSHNLFPITPLI